MSESEGRRIAEALGLRPLPFEGGLFAETYRLGPAGGGGEGRPRATAILYLLLAGEHSRLHRLRHDEIYHFYAGDPVEVLLLHPDGTGRHLLLGSAVLAGERCQLVVPAGTWQGSRLKAGGRWALLGTTMTPGFAPEDFEAGRSEALAAAYPAFAPLIAALCGAA